MDSSPGLDQQRGRIDRQQRKRVGGPRMLFQLCDSQICAEVKGRKVSWDAQCLSCVRARNVSVTSRGSRRFGPSVTTT